MAARSAPSSRMQREQPDGSRLSRELVGLFAVFCGLLIALSLITFDCRDPWMNHVVSGSAVIHNKAGLFGSYIAGLCFDMVGYAAWILPAFLCLFGARRILGATRLEWWRWFGFFFFGLCVCIAGAAGDLGDVQIFARGVIPPGSGNVSSHGGGIIGHMLYVGMVGWLSPTGTFLVWIFCFMLAMQMVTGISWMGLLVKVGNSLVNSASTIAAGAKDQHSRLRAQQQERRLALEEDAQTMDVFADPAESASAYPPTYSPAAGPAAGPGIPEDTFPEAAFLEEEMDAPAFVQRDSDHMQGHMQEDEADNDELQDFSRVPIHSAAYEPQGAVHNDYVHPMLARQSPVAHEIPAAQGQDDLPVWVRDIEEGRVGPFIEEEPHANAHETDPARSGQGEPWQPRQSLIEENTYAPHDDQAGFLSMSPEPLTPAAAMQAAPSRLAPEVAISAPRLEVHEETAYPGQMPAAYYPEDRAVMSAEPTRNQEHGLSDVSGLHALPGEPQQPAQRIAPDFAAEADAPFEEGLHAMPDVRPLVSAKTAAAMDALREVGEADPQTPLFHAGPDALTLEQGPVVAQSRSEFGAAYDAYHEEEQGTAVAPVAMPPLPETPATHHAAPQTQVPQQTQQQAPQQAPQVPASMNPLAAPADNFVKPAPLVQEQALHQTSEQPARTAAAEPLPREEYDGDIPIFEAPPVEAAPKPSIAETVVSRFKKPVMVPLPSLELLEGIPVSSSRTPREVLEEKGRSLMTCLKDFGIQGELVGITPGPVVTMFEIRPAPGVRVSRIANLSDDLALALKAVAVRIQAPVPGTDTVGIEIPNETRETVCLKELLGSQAFRQSKSLLSLAIGKDIAGNAAVADLATMPHLLVAGATGAGKSVGINSIILSLLYKARPDQVKLLLVDPKRVEMAIYADLPHLVHPVVTEMQLAKNALEWAVSEMDERYNSIAKAGVRNITDYNAKIATFGNNPPQGMEDLRPLPYLVIIIDELADLMLVAAKEVETSIVRLAQLARAAGIHLILATQRPSVDVVTGIIKANFPCRMSFQVTSKHDSRTILDAVGAEHLLGRGDMLFKPAGGKFKRMHGAFVSDQNVNSVVDYWKAKLRPEYRVDFADWAPEGAGGGVLSGGGGGGGDIENDPMYHEAVEFVRQQGKASISLIQRKCRIGFNKAARYVEQMEQDGIIGPADGSKPRLVIR